MKSNKAFTIIELSVVIVIVGLIAAGVSAGIGLIKQVQLNRVIADIKQYGTAIRAFKSQYNYYPGDLNGSLYWSGAHSGNQNGILENVGTGPSTSEQFYFWEHLADAGLIPGSYTGAGRTTNNFKPGVNIPKGPIKAAGYGTGYEANNTSISTDSLYFCGSDGNRSATPSLSPLDAMALDIKVDDGIPSMGSFITNNARNSAGVYYTTECVNNNVYQGSSILYCYIRMKY